MTYLFLQNDDDILCEHKIKVIMIQIPRCIVNLIFGKEWKHWHTEKGEQLVVQFRYWTWTGKVERSNISISIRFTTLPFGDTVLISPHPIIFSFHSCSLVSYAARYGTSLRSGFQIARTGALSINQRVRQYQNLAMFCFSLSNVLMKQKVTTSHPLQNLPYRHKWKPIHLLPAYVE